MSAELRHEALRRAEQLRSARAVEVLRRSELDVRDASAWESSDGPVRAVDVRVLTDGFALGLVRSSPIVHDAIVAAITEVAPSVLGASVIDLDFEWALRERPLESGYREPPPEKVDRLSSADVKRTLVGFLVASGEYERAREVHEGSLELSGDIVRVSVEPNSVRDALDALFGRPSRVRRVR